jgi:hypothetical protein
MRISGALRSQRGRTGVQSRNTTPMSATEASVPSAGSSGIAMIAAARRERLYATS